MADSPARIMANLLAGGTAKSVLGYNDSGSLAEVSNQVAQDKLDLDTLKTKFNLNLGITPYIEEIK